MHVKLRFHWFFVCVCVCVCCDARLTNFRRANELNEQPTNEQKNRKKNTTQKISLLIFQRLHSKSFSFTFSAFATQSVFTLETYFFFFIHIFSIHTRKFKYTRSSELNECVCVFGWMVGGTSARSRVYVACVLCVAAAACLLPLLLFAVVVVVIFISLLFGPGFVCLGR